MWLVLLIALLPTETCMSTTFGQPGDKLGSGPILLTQRPASETPLLMGFAHRSLPIGSYHLLSLRGRTVWGRVADRGPYGKTDSQGAWFNSAREPSRNGRFRGCADLLPALARALKHRGWAKLTIHVIPGQEDIRITRRKARRSNKS